MHRRSYRYTASLFTCALLIFTGSAHAATPAKRHHIRAVSATSVHWNHDPGHGRLHRGRPHRNRLHLGRLHLGRLHLG